MSENEFKLKEYFSVRIQIVKVNKKLFGWKDEVLGNITVLKLYDKDAIRLFKKLERICKKEGVGFKIE